MLLDFLVGCAYDRETNTDQGRTCGYFEWGGRVDRHGNTGRRDRLWLVYAPPRLPEGRGGENRRAVEQPHQGASRAQASAMAQREGGGCTHHRKTDEPA